MSGKMVYVYFYVQHISFFIFSKLFGFYLFVIYYFYFYCLYIYERKALQVKDLSIERSHEENVNSRQIF